MMLKIDFTYSAMSWKMHMGHCVMTEGNKLKDGLKKILTQIPLVGTVKKKKCSKYKLNYHWNSCKCASVFPCCRKLTTIDSIFLLFIPFGHFNNFNKSNNRSSRIIYTSKFLKMTQRWDDCFVNWGSRVNTILHADKQTKKQMTVGNRMYLTKIICEEFDFSISRLRRPSNHGEKSVHFIPI